MERPATAPAKTTNKSGVSTQQRRDNYEKWKKKQAETMTAEEKERQRLRDAAKAQAYRDRQKAKGLSSRATMSEEELHLVRKRNKINSLNYRNRLRGLPEVPMPPELKEAFTALRRGVAAAPSWAPIVRYIQSAASLAPARIPTPTFEEIAAADKTLPIGFMGNIELDKRYARSPYAFPTNREEVLAFQQERLAQHSTGKRVQHSMSQSVEQTGKKQRTQEGGKKTSSKANAKSKSTQKKK